MKRFFSVVSVLMLFMSASLLSGCGGEDEVVEDPIDQQLNQIMAAKTRFALAKTPTPVLTTHEWDTIFGGPDGSALKYDRFGEVDEVVFVALPGTFFNVQRQIRKETRLGRQTIYYKVTTPQYSGSSPLWIDGRFLDLRDIRPSESLEANNAAKTLLNLRSYEGAPYTWHGSSLEGARDLLDFYPPSDALTAREESDWTLVGFDSLGMLYQASNGATPLTQDTLATFGQPVFIDLSGIQADEGNDDPGAVRRKQAERLLTAVRPLDVIQMGERVWVVLDGSEIMESRYRSKFDGGVQISALFDTLNGLLEKAVFVKNPFEELEDANARPFFIRRYADTSSILGDGLSEGCDPDDEDCDNVEENSIDDDSIAETEPSEDSTIEVPADSPFNLSN